MPLRFLFAFFCATVVLTAQESRPVAAVQREAIERIVKEALGESRSFTMLEELCRKAPGRLSGTPAAAAAVEWARQTLIDVGADTVKLEPVTVAVWKRGKIEKLRVSEPAWAASEPLPILALGGSIGTPVGGITAEVIEVRSAEHLRSLGDTVKGKIVFFNQPFDRTLVQTGDGYGGAVRQRTRGAIDAAKAGGIAAIVRSVTPRLDDHPHTGAMGYEDGVTQVPAAAVSTLGAERIAKLLSKGKVVLHLELDCRNAGRAPSFNVVADLTGREKPEEIIVIGGHLDSWDVNDGAHDDGAGVVHCIEALRLLKTLDLRPKRTIRVVLFMNEENGLEGAKAYFEAHKSEMDRHILALESDSGGFTPRGFRVDFSGDSMDVIKSFGEALSVIGADKVTGGGGGADISVMNQAGVPLMSFWPDGHRYFDLHHSVLDVIGAVHERELAAGSAAIAAMVWMIGESDHDFGRTKPRERPRR